MTTAPAEGIDGTELTKEVSVDVDNLIAHSKFKTSKIEFTEPEVTVQAEKNETFDLNLNAPDWWGRHRTVGKIPFSSLKPEHIEISKDAPLSVSENGISINSDAKPGTYTITVAIGSLSAVKTIKVADKTELCKHPENSRTTDEKTPSCTESGYRKEICGECGKILSEKTLEKTDHEKEADWNTEKEADCTEDGKMVKKCIHCGTLLEEAIVPALGHQWSEWKVEKEPAWDSEGMQKRVCSRCTETEEQVLPKLSEVHEHDYTGDETIIKEAACTEDGSKYVACSNPDCDAKIIVTIPAAGHNAGEGETIKEATCTENGETLTKCTNCGMELEKSLISALGHQWSEWKVEEEPAWDSEGRQTRTCSRCMETEEQVLPKLSEVHEHDYTGGETIVKEATCTEDGNKQVSCVDPNCDSKITVTIPKFGHEYSEWKVIREATYTEEGERQRICENCGDVQMEIINKISLPKDDDTVTPDQNQKPDQNQTTDQIPGQAQEVKKEDDIQKNKNQDEDQNTDSEEVVKTGDNNNIYFWGGLAAATAFFVSVIVISSKRKINS